MCDEAADDAAALLIIYTCFDMENKKIEKKKKEKENGVKSDCSKEISILM